MKRRFVIFGTVFVAILLVATSSAQVGGGSFTMPASSLGSSPTTPGSAYRSNLVPSRNDFYGRDQNLVVTGNVSGGRHFRGIVPYNSVDSLGAVTNIGATSSVESFIRRTAGVPYIDSDPSLVQPYYLPRQTVTSVLRGTTSGLVPPRVEFFGGTGKFAVTKAKPPQPADTLGIYRPRSMLSMSAAELERLSGRETLLNTFDLPIRDLLKNNIVVGLEREKEKAVPQGPRPEEPVPLKELLDESLDPTEPLSPTVPLTAKTQELKELLEKDQEAHRRLLDEADQQLRAEEERRTKEAEEAAEPKQESKYKIKLPEKRQIPEVDREKVKAILGEHKTYKSLAQAKFDEFMKSGNAFMKEGKYYKAVNAYVLATVWNSRDGQVNLYRGIAHFAAGEYISGSLFVNRAILLAPDIAGEKIDLTAILPNKDLIDNRLIEAADWQKRSGSGEIALLLAYIYHQQDRPDKAQNFIKIAQEKLPESKAVEALKKAIDAASK